MANDLVEKYNIPEPRYTSYPTVHFWDQSGFSKEEWVKTIKQVFVQNRKEISPAKI